MRPDTNANPDMHASPPSMCQFAAAAANQRSGVAGLGDRLCCAIWITAAVAVWALALEALGALTWPH